MDEVEKSHTRPCIKCSEIRTVIAGASLVSLCPAVTTFILGHLLGGVLLLVRGVVVRSEKERKKACNIIKKKPVIYN